MTDALRSRIIAHTDQPDIYDPPAHTDMYARILRDAETIKAAEEMADAAEDYIAGNIMAERLEMHIAAFHAKQEAR